MIRLLNHQARRLLLLTVIGAGLSLCSPAWALNIDRLTQQEEQIRLSIMEVLEPIIEQYKQDGTANLLAWETLYAPLSDKQRSFLDDFRSLKASSLGATSHYFGKVNQDNLAPVGSQTILKNGKIEPVNPQYLPELVLISYRKMMEAMQQSLGKKLLVESGYRSPAYQLYLFLYYMPNHDISIKETNRFVALPGHSEHGYPPQQAIDFINEHGINGEEIAEEFEVLPEYEWLQKNAVNYGFTLSYPRDNAYNTAFEPWHWHFEDQ